MLELKIPGFGEVKIKNIVCDLNGTLSMKGQIDPVLPGRIKQLLDQGINVFILSADTRGKLNVLAKELGAQPHRLKFEGRESTEKAEFIKTLGEDSVIALGNGNNDYLMLKRAKIGICVIGEEGAANKAILNSDICVPNPQTALDLLLDPTSLISTLRD